MRRETACRIAHYTGVTGALLWYALVIALVVFIIGRAMDQNNAAHNPVVPAAVNSVAPDDEGTAALSPLDFTTDSLPPTGG